MPLAEAVERLGQAVRDGWGAGYDASVVRGLSKSTLDGYLGTLAKLRRRERMQPGCDRRRVLEDELGDIAAQDVGEGNIKKLLSGQCRQRQDFPLCLGVHDTRHVPQRFHAGPLLDRALPLPLSLFLHPQDEVPVSGPHCAFYPSQLLE